MKAKIRTDAKRHIWAIFEMPRIKHGSTLLHVRPEAQDGHTQYQTTRDDKGENSHGPGESKRRDEPSLHDGIQYAGKTTAGSSNAGGNHTLPLKIQGNDGDRREPE